MLNEMNQLSYDGTDDNLTSLPEDEITSVYGKQLCSPPLGLGELVDVAGVTQRTP